jgi:hypothetical protein
MSDPKSMLTGHNIGDDAIRAQIEAVPPPNPSADFLVELKAAVDRHRQHVEMAKIVEMLEFLTKVLKAGVR